MEKISEALRCLILGVVQGLTEFLPVSSSFHLRLVPLVFGWPQIGIALSAFLHLGTLIGVLLYFGKDLLAVATDGWKELTVPNFSMGRFAQTLAFKIIIGSIPAVLIGFIFHDKLEELDNNFWLTTSCLIVVGIVLWLSDLRHSHSLSIDKSLTWQQALIIGCSQALALVPGVSRSGSTISAARFMNYSRADAARFSFLLGAPVVFGAGVFELLKVIKHSTHMEVSISSCLLGCASSAAVGFFAIKFLLKFLQSNSLFPFMIYRVVVGSIVLFCLYKGTLK